MSNFIFFFVVFLIFKITYRRRLRLGRTVGAPVPNYQTRPWLCRKEFPQRQKAVKQVKYLSGGKRSTARVERQTVDSERERIAESHLHGNWNCFYGSFLLDFLWPAILICLVHSPYLVYFRILPDLHMHLLPIQRGIWVEHLLTSFPFDLQGGFLHLCGQGGLLTFRTRSMWSRLLP